MTNRIDPERDRKPAFDTDKGKFGQGYSLDEEKKLACDMPTGSVAAKPSQVTEGEAELPPENGRRASFDPVTGEVRGSGVGAGGGAAGEDMDEDRAGGDGGPLTGKGSRQDPS